MLSYISLFLLYKTYLSGNSYFLELPVLARLDISFNNIYICVFTCMNTMCYKDYFYTFIPKY